MSKKLKTTCLAVALSLITVVVTSFKNSPGNDLIENAFGVKLVDAVKAKNYELFKKLIINLSEYTDMVMGMELSDDEKIEEIERFKQRKDNNSEAFKMLLERIVEGEMDFSKIKFERAKSEFDPERETSSFNVTVFFSDGKMNGELRAWQCYQTKNGIKLKSCPYFKKGTILDPTCDTFAKEIFEMLKKESKEEYRKYVVTDYAFISLVKSSRFDIQEQERIIEDINKKSPEKAAKGQFYSIMAQIYKKEIDLNKVQNLTWEYKREDEKGVNIANITLYFDFDSKKYAIRTREAFRTPAGWKLSREMDLSRDSYNSEEEDYETEEEEEYEEEAPEEVEADTASVDDYEMEKSLDELNREVKRQMEADSVKAAQLDKDKKKKKKK